MPTAEDFGAGGEVALFPGTVRLARLFGYTAKGELCSPFLDDKAFFFQEHTETQGLTWLFRNSMDNYKRNPFAPDDKMRCEAPPRLARVPMSIVARVRHRQAPS